MVTSAYVCLGQASSEESRLSESASLQGQDHPSHEIERWNTFQEVGTHIPPLMLESLTGNPGYFEAPTAIQACTWPVMIHGNDAICVTRKGSGKTLGFLIPTLLRLYLAAWEAATEQTPEATLESMCPPDTGPFGLVLLPTRLCCAKVYAECVRFGGAGGVRFAMVHGGEEDRAMQLERLHRERPHIVVACPGRLFYYLRTQEINLENIKSLIIIGGDGIIRGGLEWIVRDIIDATPVDRQSLMFSASFSSDVKTLGKKLCVQEPVFLDIR